MFKLVRAAVLAGAAALLVQSLPDIKRYLVLKNM